MTDTDAPSEVDQHLATAQALAASGRALEAIDCLVEINRRRRDPVTEQRLVELRHAAFAELSTAPGRTEWPPTFADPFPDTQEVPVAAPHQLSPAVLGGAIVNHGCLQVPGLVDPATVERLLEGIEKAHEARERVAEGAPAESAAPWYVPFALGQAKAEGFGRDRFVRAVDSPAMLWELAELFTRLGVIEAVTEYFNERPAMIANKWLLRRSPSGVEFPDYHQDGAFLGDGIRTVDCWVALTRCGPGTGRPGMDLIPRRFGAVLPTGEGATLPWALSEQVVHAAAPGVAVCSPVFEPGDALFFDELLPHRTAVGLELGPRYAVESWFVAPSSYPAKHVPVVI